MKGPDKVSYYGIDVIKFLFALLVVTAHFDPFGDVSGTASYIARHYVARMTVPFFYLATAFFLFRKLDIRRPDWRLAGGYLKRILRLYLVWVCLYLPLMVLEAVQSGASAWDMLLFDLRHVLVIGYYHFWFLHALLVASVLVFAMLRAGLSLPWVLAVTFCLYLYGLCGHTYHDLFAAQLGGTWLSGLMDWLMAVLITPRNGIFFAGVYMALGAWLAVYRAELPRRWLYPLLALSWLLFWGEVSWINPMSGAREFDMYLMALPVSVLTFMWARQLVLPAGRIYGHLRNLSMLIYYIHFGVILVYLDVIRMYTGWQGHSVMVYLVVIAVSCLLGELIMYLGSTERWGFAACLYTGGAGLLSGIRARLREVPAGTRKLLGWGVVLFFCGACLGQVFLGPDVWLKGDDQIFHLNRLEGIREGLLAGQLPVRIHGYQFNGYGTPTGYFYPDTFLYVPALLRLSGLSLGMVNNLYWLGLIYFGLFAGWYAYGVCLKSVSGGAVASILYNTMYYMLFCLGGVWGAAMAMAFLPLAFMAMRCILQDEAGERYWPLLVLAVTGVLQSHVLSSLLLIFMLLMMAATGCRSFARASCRRTMGKVLAFVLGLNMWRLVPFGYMYLLLDFQIKDTAAYAGGTPSLSVMTSSLRGLWEAQLWWGWPLVALMLLLGLWELGRLRQQLDWYAVLFFCLLLTAGLSSRFPWPFLEGLPLLGTILPKFQMATRFLPLGGVLLAFYCGRLLLARLGGRAFGQAALVLVAGMTSVCAAWSMQHISFEMSGVQVETGTSYGQVEPLPSYGQGQQEDYLYQGVHFAAMKNGAGDVLQATDYVTDAEVLHFAKQGTSVELGYQAETETDVQLPLFYYPGYVAWLADEAGCELAVYEDERHLLHVRLPAGCHTMRTEYRELPIFRVLDLVAMVSAVWFLLSWYRERKKI